MPKKYAIKFYYVRTKITARFYLYLSYVHTVLISVGSNLFIIMPHSAKFHVFKPHQVCPIFEKRKKHTTHFSATFSNDKSWLTNVERNNDQKVTFDPNAALQRNVKFDTEWFNPVPTNMEEIFNWHNQQIPHFPMKVKNKNKTKRKWSQEVTS